MAALDCQEARHNLTLAQLRWFNWDLREWSCTGEEPLQRVAWPYKYAETLIRGMSGLVQGGLAACVRGWPVTCHRPEHCSRPQPPVQGWAAHGGRGHLLKALR